jgi:hypothetical protein
MSNPENPQKPDRFEELRRTALGLAAAVLVLWGISSLVQGKPDQEPVTFPNPPVATLFPTVEGALLEVESVETTATPYYRGAAELPATSQYTTTATPTWTPIR